ncbi:MAG: hypothetical protein FWG00_05900 [Coriobacteriia bacterium]|nr:hypothetical protein [Coriobacteriia bacterium]
MDVKIYYKSGSIQTFKSSYLPYPDGFLTEEDFLHLYIEEVLENGLVLDRLAFEAEELVGEEEKEFVSGVLQTKNVLVPKEKIDDVLMVVVDGILVIQRTGDHLTNLILNPPPKKGKQT